jgi:hypothetical protein
VVAEFDGHRRTNMTNQIIVFRNFANAYEMSDLIIYNGTGCPTTYQTRQFFNNFTTNEDIAHQLGAHYRHSSSFLTYERTPVQISLQYLNWFWNY